MDEKATAAELTVPRSAAGHSWSSHLLISASPHRLTVSTIPFRQARDDATAASVGRPFGLRLGGSRTPHPALPQSALIGLEALVELKNGSVRPDCESVTLRPPARSTRAMTSYGWSVSIPSDAPAPYSRDVCCMPPVVVPLTSGMLPQFTAQPH